MRKFKLKVGAMDYPTISAKEVYCEDFIPQEYSKPIKYLTEKYPEDWEEVFDTITPTTESEKNKFVISYISKDGLIVLNNIIEADNFQEAIDIIKGDEGVRAILSCYKS